MTPRGEIGVVLSGGGSNGAYEVGVLKALIEGASPATDYRPIDPISYTGTSVGAYNATAMAARGDLPSMRAVAELEEIWLDRIANSVATCGNGVYRIRGLPFQLLDPGCLASPFESLAAFGRDSIGLAAFGLAKGVQLAVSDRPLDARLLALFQLDALISESPLAGLIEQTIDLDRLASSRKRLTIAASNWELGVLRLFSRREIAETAGSAAVLASAALPGIFPPVTIDGVPYVDGGVLLNTPLKPAIEDGADEIHVIFLDPLVENIPLLPLPGSIDTFYRLFAVIWAQRVRADVAVAEEITRTIELLETELPAAAPPPPGALRSFVRHGHRIYRRLIDRGEYRKLTIHVYRPATDLGGGPGLLDFRQERMAGLVELGYADAVTHDCANSGCVLLAHPAVPRRAAV